MGVFDKAKYREKKYSHVKKLNDWKKNHKIDAERKYKKMLRKEEKKNQFLAKSNPNMQPLGQKSVHSKTENKQKSGLNKAKKTFEEKVAAKRKAEEEAEKKQKEKEEAVKRYKEKKAQKSKALRAVTKRGQPVMAGRMELLLAKIQEQCSQ